MDLGRNSAACLALAAITLVTPPFTLAQSKRPNIVIIWGDDIGQSNVSACSHGVMGYKTPNIDRVAREGMMFTDYYAEQSCTAGRASFITGQHGLRTGMTKVGLPAATLGLQKEDPTIAELLKPLGYATGQFGKNHLGDRNEFLPTVHGFDEFYGNLYHLNAEEEPEHPDYPKDPAFRAKYGPRGVMDCRATDKDDATVDPRFGRVGRQMIKDTGPLTRKRMETIDDDVAARAADFIQRQSEANKPFFVWVNFTHMHARTYPKPESRGQSGRWQIETEPGKVLDAAGSIFPALMWKYSMTAFPARLALIYCALCVALRVARGDDDPLPSWNDTGPKATIVAFVERVTLDGSPDFVRPAERIAVFDNDGCLWAEQPMYFQAFFSFDRIKALAPQHPDWKKKEPFASVLKGDVKTALAGGEHALLEMVMATHAGMTTEEFEKIVTDWIATARHPVTERPFTEMVYQPMLEVLAYLRANGFRTLASTKRNSAAGSWRI